MLGDQTIGVVIPALNEERSIGRVLASLPSVVDRVVVVDNGSVDQTTAVAAAHGAQVARESSRGYGSACLAGIAAIADRADILVFLDADFSDRPEQLAELVAPIAAGDADLVIGSRTLGRRERGALTVPQRFGNALACRLIRWSWRRRYTDLGPFRAVRTAALDCLRMDDRTYGWTVQMQIRAMRAGLRVLEVPVDYRRRIGRSKISGTLRGVIGAGTKILATVLRERTHCRPVSVFAVRPEHLIVFTRYPEPGRTKTRLMPALGAAGAADLQRVMTRRTLLTAERLRFTRHVSTEVRFAGGDQARMAELYGQRQTYLRQRDGDLGARMHRALAEAFARGSERAVVIGTDCPAIDGDVLNAAFDALRSSDCVIGPARDGGYYLIGLRRTCRPLFEGITWGSPDVLERTLRQAASAGLTVRQLAELSDVDEPQDLAEWERCRCPRISIVIPALNEVQHIAQAVGSALHAERVEVLVVDGGSRDGTPQAARAAGARVLHSSAGRARQMNEGAAAARGSILLFLHADTRLPPGYADQVERLLAQPDATLAAFRLRIDHPRAAFRCIERIANLRSRWLGVPYGDQAFALRAESFWQMEGYRDMAVMEDFELVLRARRIGRVVLSEASVRTSARRWLANGILRTTLVNQACLLGHALGVSPRHLARWRGARDERRRASEHRAVIA